MRDGGLHFSTYLVTFDNANDPTLQEGVPVNSVCMERFDVASMKEVSNKKVPRKSA